MGPLRTTSGLAAVILLLVPALAGAAAGCKPKACSAEAERAHDCCPPAPASLVRGCCDASAAANAPRPTVSPDRHLLVAAAVEPGLLAPPAAEVAIGPVEALAVTAATSSLHAVLRL